MMDIASPSEFTWDQPDRTHESLNETWIKFYERGGYDPGSILDGFLNIPTHSQRSHPQLDELKAINLNGALDDIQQGRFKGSLLWLHDFDGTKGRDYNGVMSAEAAWNNLQYNVRIHHPLQRYLQSFGISSLTVSSGSVRIICQMHVSDDCECQCINTGDCRGHKLTAIDSHLHHPTPESIGVLVHAVSLHEIKLLRTFLGKHIRGQKATIRFNIEVSLLSDLFVLLADMMHP